jgi:hydrogenase maturation protease
MATLVLGMGNPILSDDGLGLVVARRLRDLPMPPDVEVAESEVGGLRLLELVRGFTKVVIIDALRSGGTPGEIKRVAADEFRGGHRYGSAHSIHLGTVLQLGDQLGVAMPAEVVVYTVEALDVETFGERLSEPVAAAAERLVGLIGDELRLGACPPGLETAS